MNLKYLVLEVLYLSLELIHYGLMLPDQSILRFQQLTDFLVLDIDGLLQVLNLLHQQTLRCLSDGY